MAVLAGIITFTVIRLRTTRGGRAGRRGSPAVHTGAAWLVLGMIFRVIATLLLYRGAQINTGVFPYPHGAFASQIVGHWLRAAGHGGEQRARDGVHAGPAGGGARRSWCS